MSALTTAEAFDEFHRKIKLTPKQRQTINERRDNIEGYLREAFPTGSDLPFKAVQLIGSGRRNTMIRPLNDLDVMASFTNRDEIFERYRDDSRKFLYRVRDALSTHSDVKVVGARGQAVRFFYSDGLHVDIAPVFKWKGDGYALPSGKGNWLTTDPEVHQEYLKQRAAASGGDLQAHIRGLKKWNRAHSNRMKPFHLEVLAASAPVSLADDRGAGFQAFFEHAKNHLKVADPAGYSDDLSGYLGFWSKDAVRESFSEANRRAKKALKAEQRGDHKEAIRLWRVIFGDDFPAYG